ncbi:MAG TPA: nitrile hydratase subunit alpha, partial [Nocardioidaceae bacterium]|nr:nitrile hydratase subunit alpha [Nocardioidaceae bacterium]
KDPAYRSRIVREPRTLLAEMGLTLDEDTEVRVWDSSSEVRYFVLPERPEGTDDLTEEQLAALVTRDAMVGVGRVPGPGATCRSSWRSPGRRHRRGRTASWCSRRRGRAASSV